MTAELTPAEPLNTGEFMMGIIAGTPRKMREVDGIVCVDARMHLDERGTVVNIELRCKTVSGRAVAPDDPEILEGARRALSVLRFAPARLKGRAVPYVYEMTFGFTTAALDFGYPPYALN